MRNSVFKSNCLMYNKSSENVTIGEKSMKSEV